jgi:hypothetical protein
VASGKEISIERAPTRWGRVSFSLTSASGSKSIAGHVELSGATVPREVYVKLRLPERMPLRSVTVNGKPTNLGAMHKDTVIIATNGQRKFEVAGQLV